LQRYEESAASLRRAIELRPELREPARTTFGALLQDPTYGQRFTAALGD
jgi:hypothetical protein